MITESNPWIAASPIRPGRSPGPAIGGLTGADSDVRDPPGPVPASPAIDGTVYDTAWLASLPSREDPTTSRYPASLEWLVDQQHPDGSWGGEIAYEPDRVISTIAALVPLARFPRGERRQECVRRGTRYLWQRGHLLAREPVELVGYELLLPALVERAKQAGLAVPPHLDLYEKQRREKLRLLPADQLYSPRTTAAHSLEFLGDRAPAERLRGVIGANGSVGNSPAATAFVLTQLDDPRAQSYLDECLTPTERAAAPVLFPCETFELLWSAYHLFLAGVPARALLSPSVRVALNRALQADGVSLSPSFPIPDADDTAVALLLLSDMGDEVDAHVLKRFARPEGHFASFPYERHASVGVNVHVLHALLHASSFPERDSTVLKLLDFIASQQIGGLFWYDKWHISPYYATSHALRVLAELPDELRQRAAPMIQRAREWIRFTQMNDGAWGFYGTPTAEETAYAMLGLTCDPLDPDDASDWDRCADADQYLETVLRPGAEAAYPALWVDKCLYRPNRVVRAAIDAGRIAFRGARPHARTSLTWTPNDYTRVADH